MAEATSEDMSTMESVSAVDKSGTNLSLSDLSMYFHLPIAEAAQRIKVCATVLKKVCRKNNIPRWPHRKIKSYDRAIQALTDTLGMNPDQDVAIRAQLADLQQKKAYVLQNPESIVNSSRKKRSAPVYSLEPKKIKREAINARAREEARLMENFQMPPLQLDSIQPSFFCPPPPTIHFDPYTHQYYYPPSYHQPQYSSVPPTYYSPTSDSSHSPHSPHSPHSTASASSSATLTDSYGLLPYMPTPSSYYPRMMSPHTSHEGTTEGY